MMRTSSPARSRTRDIRSAPAMCRPSGTRKYFETALRLRMNMVAPYTRVHRRYEVQKMASDWGLFYTSHHYDILLSNPFGIERYGLGKGAELHRRRGTGSTIATR